MRIMYFIAGWLFVFIVSIAGNEWRSNQEAKIITAKERIKFYNHTVKLDSLYQIEISKLNELQYQLNRALMEAKQKRGTRDTVVIYKYRNTIKIENNEHEEKRL